MSANDKGNLHWLLLCFVSGGKEKLYNSQGEY